MCSCNKQCVALCLAWALLLQLALAGFSCLSNPCLYGICMDDINSSYTCYCMDGYTGNQCSTNWDECWSSPCGNGATCIDGVATFNCSCPPGFTGLTCEEDVDECQSNPCFNNGICQDGVNGYSCTCLPGYQGILCEVDIAVCNMTGVSLCINGGVCIEGPGDTFSCACLQGWTGQICETAVDECVSSPCQNGGVCVDLFAGYSCACPFGYTGSNCEVKLHPCLVSPCLNQALCLVEAGTRVCYCVPDYHGDRCQFQYDECQLGPRCLNGGTCLDGVDNYTCSCPPDLTGSLCECLIMGPGLLDCSYISPTPLSLMSETVTDQTSTVGPVTWQHTLVYDNITLTSGWTSFGQSEAAMSTTTSAGGFTMSYPETSTDTSSQQVPEETVSGLSSQLLTGTISSPRSSEDSTQIFVETESAVTPRVALDTSGSTEGYFTLRYQPRVSTEGVFDEITTLETSGTTQIFGLPGTTQTAGQPGTTHTSELPDTTQAYELPGTTQTSEPSTTTQTSEPPTTQTSEIPTTTQTSEPPTTTQTEQLPGTTQTSELSGPTPECPETEYTSGTAITAITYPSSTEISSTTDLGSSSESEFYSSSTEEQSVDCSVFPCQNSGTCVYTRGGPRCMCKFGWEGPVCEEPAGIREPAFTGQSYLSHRLYNGSEVRVEVLARTLAPTGLILYASLPGDKYLCLFLQEGLLQFQFSCGLQTMLFSEVQMNVNNGYHMSVLVQLVLLPGAGDTRRCHASLRINNTLVMSGEQISAVTLSLEDPSGGMLHLAGVPPHLAQDLVTPRIVGFTGCMKGLKVSNRSRHIFKDAVDGQGVSECSSLACLSNPCYSAATCVEYKDHWHCLCPSGYVGVRCERSVCSNNPCMFGATCVVFTASGFLCLCPLGKHGVYCEHDVDVAQPQFWSSVGGLSSYAAYQLPGTIHNSLELKLRFSPTTMDQIALLVFVGQEGLHTAQSDHLALSFIKGYLVLTWNLGSGPRRIFTPRPVTPRANRPHTVRLGRVGQTAWLLVDNLGNVSGRSPGRLSQLNTRSVLYLGGHESANFSQLPHDLPLHTGFSGCLFDVELRAGRVSVALQRTRAAIGRSVGQCGTSECHQHACHNGGACLHHGATFTCLCPEGWFGPLCSQRYNPCDSNRHKCKGGATCVPLNEGYHCDCPLGKAGTYCDKDEQLSDVSFSGQRSYLSLPPATLNTHQACVDLEVRPLSDRGLVLFAAKEDSKSFVSLSLQGGVMELRVSPGRSRRRGEPLVVRSGRVLALGEWHRVVAGRYGRRFYLRVDGTVNSGALLPGETLPSLGAPLQLGGLEDLSHLPASAVSGLPLYFSGCLRQLAINWQRVPLNTSHILRARNVADCDGTACGGDVCDNSGSCWLDKEQRPRCACLQMYTGARCETQISCAQTSCLNDGRCVEESGFVSRCHCPVGWGGAFCQDNVNVSAPHFRGNSYLRVERSAPRPTREREQLITGVDISYIFLNLSTVEPDGMILWTSQAPDQFLGVGVSGGLVRVVWSRRETVLVSGGAVCDGAWHGLTLSLGPGNVSLWVDHQLIHSHEENTSEDLALTTDGVFYLGGFPNQKSVTAETRGHFSSRFSGCLKELSWNKNYIVTDFSQYTGENIGSCDLGHG